LIFSRHVEAHLHLPGRVIELGIADSADTTITCFVM